MDGLIKENWHNLKVNDKTYLIKFYFTDDEYELLLFDWNEFKLYYEKKTKNQIEKYLNKYNSSIEAPISKINKHLKQTLLDSSSCKLNEIKNDSSATVSAGGISIHMECKLSGIKFIWKFDFDLLKSSEIKEQLLLPLLVNYAELQLRENELCKLLQNKDKEIDDYKSQGNKLTRKYLETVPFDKDSFDKSMKQNNKIPGILESPEKSLYTPLAHTVQDTCAEKYFKIGADGNAAATSTLEDNIVIKSPTQTQPKTTPKRKETEEDLSRRDLIKQQREESAKKTEKQKKKKLF